MAKMKKTSHRAQDNKHMHSDLATITSGSPALKISKWGPSGAWEIFYSNAMNVLQFSISQGQLRCLNASPRDLLLFVCFSCTLLLKCSLLPETKPSLKSWLQRTGTPVTRRHLLPFSSICSRITIPILNKLACGLSIWWLISHYGSCYAESSICSE